MVGVAQLVEHGIVTPVVEGSIPFVHPIFKKRQINHLAFLFLTFKKAAAVRPRVLRPCRHKALMLKSIGCIQAGILLVRY